MERRSFLKRAGVGLAASAAAMPAIAQNAPSIKWRLASSFPKSLDTLYGTGEFLVKRIADMTGGAYFTAESATELEEVFRSLPTYLITREETTEISVLFAAAGALLVILAVILAQLWHPLP